MELWVGPHKSYRVTKGKEEKSFHWEQVQSKFDGTYPDRTQRATGTTSPTMAGGILRM